MALTFHLPDVRDRARAAFLGLALGDALGAVVEFRTATEIAAEHGTLRELVGGGWLRLRAGQVTDDTEMSLWLARAITDAGGWSLPACAAALASWMKGRPRDVGATVRRGLRRYLLDGSLAGPPAEGDAGNGAVMRMVPPALLTLADRAALERVAIDQGHLTHHHPLSDAACVLLGRLLHHAVLGLSLARLRRVADEAIAAEPRLRFAGYRGPTSGYVADSMRTALRAFFDTDGFEACLVEVVNRGGDADTNAAIAGALAGAYHGPAGLPARWLARLEPAVRAECEVLALELVALSPLAHGAPPSL